MQTRSTFLRRALLVGAAIAFAPTKLDDVLTPEATTTGGFAAPQPTGSIAQFANAVPDGWFECDGTAVSKLDHPDLYAVFGTAFGGSRLGRKFRLPDLRVCTSTTRYDETTPPIYLTSKFAVKA